MPSRHPPYPRPLPLSARARPKVQPWLRHNKIYDAPPTSPPPLPTSATDTVLGLWRSLVNKHLNPQLNKDPPAITPVVPIAPALPPPPHPPPLLVPAVVVVPDVPKPDFDTINKTRRAKPIESSKPDRKLNLEPQAGIPYRYPYELQSNRILLRVRNPQDGPPPEELKRLDVIGQAAPPPPMRFSMIMSKLKNKTQ